jgi:hypothetical protein
LEAVWEPCGGRLADADKLPEVAREMGRRGAVARVGDQGVFTVAFAVDAQVERMGAGIAPARVGNVRTDKHTYEMTDEPFPIDCAVSGALPFDARVVI